jgi:hypothetical protein
MLERFAALDEAQSAPTLVGLRQVAVVVLGMRVAMGVDLAYKSDVGWHLRHLITDHEITRSEHLRLYATASALHFEGRSSGGPVTSVDVWMLPYDDRRLLWDRETLGDTVGRLAARLDEIARGAAGQAA